MSGADDGDRYVAERRTLNNLTLLRYIDVSNNGRAILEFGREREGFQLELLD